MNFRIGFAARLLAGAFIALLGVTDVDARVGGGFSGGSRGMRTFTAPPVTRTAPTAAQSMQRTVTQPMAPARPVAGPGGVFNRPGGLFGGGLFGGLAAGFLGAGLFGMLFGHGFMGGIGGFASFLGLILQVGLVAFLAMAAWRWFMRRNEPAMAGSGPMHAMNFGGFGNGLGFGGSGGNQPRSAGPSDDIGISPVDYDRFERLLGEIQTGYSNEDIAALRQHATPEMVSYFSEDLADNAGRGLVNRVSDIRLLQGDLAEAWREGNREYASVAMRFSLVDQMIERASNKVVDGSAQPQEVTEVWTFMRPRGGDWMLSAIQQA